MRHSDKHRFLDDVLTGSEVAEFREASLREALTAVRSVRRRRKVVRRIAWVGAPLIIGLLVLDGALRDSSRLETVPTTPAAVAATAEPARSSSVAYVSDEDLLALFPDQPLALVGPEGQQQLVFLSQAVPN